MNLTSSHSQSKADSVVVALESAAKALGFVALGFSRPQKPLFFHKYLEWIAAGKHGEMKWLEKWGHLRRHPEGLLQGCRTIISLAYPYSPAKPATPDGYTAARYSGGRTTDYHFTLRELAGKLAACIVSQDRRAKVRVCVDSAPVLERSFAYGAGIGFIGKNNMLILPDHGSFHFLAEILTTTPLPIPERTPMDHRCGSCSLCLDACPTGALEGPFTLNASRCLSYLTIEHQGKVDAETGAKMGNCFFGCDVCQEVCPFNVDTRAIEHSLPASDVILDMSKKDFGEIFGKSAFGRAGLEKIKDNIRAITHKAPK